MARFSLDSNILVYTVDNRFPVRRVSALDVMTRAALLDCILVPQSLAEFFNVASRKAIMPRSAAIEQLTDWIALFAIAPGPTADAVLTAAAASAAGRFQFYDALLLATAAAAGCTALISEDMADGATLSGVEVVSAFDAAGRISRRAVALLAT